MKKVVLRYLNLLPLPLSFLIPFLLTIPNSIDRDMWYHIAIGRYITTQRHLPQTDVFSFTAGERIVHTTEWIFQVILYEYQHLFGLGSLGIFVGIITGAEILLLFLLLRYITKANVWLSLLISFLYFARISNTATVRPFGFANILLLTWIGILILYVQRNNTKLLLLLIPLMYFWVNSHGSFIVGCLLLSAFAVTYFLYGLITNKKLEKKQSIFMGIFAIFSWLITVLPPLFLGQYQVLLLYFKYRSNALYIIEWQPISFYDSLIYIATIALAGFFLFVLYKRELSKLLILVPFLPLLILPFESQRHVLVAFIPVVLMLGFLAKKVQEMRKNFFIALSSGLFGLLLIGEGIFYFQYYQTIHKGMLEEPYPVQAVEFIKNYHLQGNMLNSYNFGGYLLDHLYPQQKVFVDAWADPNICCEIGYLKGLLYAKTPEDEQHKFDDILSLYDISFVLVTRTPTEVDMTKLMANEKKFSLIYWDDAAQIYVKDDGKNTKLLDMLKLTNASPFSSQAFDKNNPEKAMNEYKRMVAIADSAKSRNIMGTIALYQKNTSLAREEFKKAIEVNPTFIPPYLNLAAMDIQTNNISEAISLYEMVIQKQSDFGLSYYYLGKLYLSLDGNSVRAKQIWQQGVDATSDQSVKSALQNLLEITL